MSTSRCSSAAVVRSRTGSATTRTPGFAKFPFKQFALNEVWLEIVLLAHDLIVWTQALLLDGELANTEPKRLPNRLLHVAGRLAFSGPRAKLHLQRAWPWVNDLVAAFDKLKALPATAG